MDITATVDPALFAVRLTATGYTGTVDWYRRYRGEDAHLGTGASLIDFPPQVNIPYEYVAVDDLEADVSPIVTVESDKPVLSSTASAIARQVDVVDYRPVEGVGRSVWHPVLGRTKPFVTIHPALYPSGLLRLHAPTPDERVALIRMLELGEPLLLRSTCPDRVDTMTFLMTRWRDPFAGYRKHGAAYLEIDFQRVDEDTGLQRPPVRTYTDVHAEGHATYQDLLDTYSTYRDLLDGTPVP